MTLLKIFQDDWDRRRRERRREKEKDRTFLSYPGRNCIHIFFFQNMRRWFDSHLFIFQSFLVSVLFWSSLISPFILVVILSSDPLFLTSSPLLMVKKNINNFCGEKKCCLRCSPPVHSSLMSLIASSLFCWPWDLSLFSDPPLVSWSFSVSLFRLHLLISFALSTENCPEVTNKRDDGPKRDRRCPENELSSLNEGLDRKKSPNNNYSSDCFSLLSHLTLSEWSFSKCLHAASCVIKRERMMPRPSID